MSKEIRIKKRNDEHYAMLMEAIHTADSSGLITSAARMNGYSRTGITIIRKRLEKAGYDMTAWHAKAKAMADERRDAAREKYRIARPFKDPKTPKPPSVRATKPPGVRAEEADHHVLEALRRMGTPCTFNAITLATPQVSAPRVSQALARMVRRQVIIAESHRFVQVTRWTVSAINPETYWRRT
jgi:hypothetical protein